MAKNPMAQNKQPNYQKNATMNANRIANQNASNQNAGNQYPYKCQPNQGFQCGMVGDNEICIRNPLYSQNQNNQ